MKRCEWCGATFEWAGQGRPPKYCRRSHRQRHYEARREAERLGIDGVLIRSDDWQRLQDAVYGLEAAVDDAVLDLASGDQPGTVVATLASAVATMVGAVPEPSARSDTSL